MEANAATIKALFPEFSSVSDLRIEKFVEVAKLSVNEKSWKESYGVGVSYLTAHLLKRAGSGGGVQGGSSNAGVIASEKVGELQRTYAQPNVSGSGNDAILATTSYGVEYLRLRRQLLITPMVT